MMTETHDDACQRPHSSVGTGRTVRCPLPDWMCRVMHEESTGRLRHPSDCIHYVSMSTGICMIGVMIGPADMQMPSPEDFAVLDDGHGMPPADRDTVSLWLANRAGSPWPFVPHVPYSPLCVPGTWHERGTCAVVDVPPIRA